MKKASGIILAVLVSLLCMSGGALAQEKNVTFVDFSWNSVQMHNRIAGFVLEHGYGFKPEYLFAESVPGLTGLAKGDVDIAMEMWVDNVLEWYNEAVGRNKAVIDLGPTFPDSPQGWYVPTYVIEGDPERGIEPMAPDLKSVFDLPKYWELFKDPENPKKGRFYNAIPGWVVHDINMKKLDAYGLTDTYQAFGPGSQTALATAIVTAYQRGNPVLAYYWEPEWIMGMLDMTRLEEPPYDPEKWGEGKSYGCAFPAARVHIGINTEFARKNPEILTFLANYETSLEQNNAALAYMQQEEATVEDAAIWFLKEYEDAWTKWIPDEETRKKVLEALK
ncbi:MAG: Putative ABC transporter, periplasmic substrate-binding protein [Synergistales bacterium 53_16]|jgi:glycine betaine/proline transport system substrate-binding protein|nr:MAG: Putative ABC transporter, periplasmic substrate-binding protein [Synergistales bacterium 53_16]KUL01535.1 MAG: Putative ABC transporter, periplasmic substrate-binding protein [Synergistales bacterium 54_9]MDK2846161.1 glycine betaine/proline transport system substrate-binding protein [Synergistales bacterium]